MNKREEFNRNHASIEVKTPKEIEDLLWDEIPLANEYRTPAELHNTLILGAFIRGQESLRSKLGEPSAN